MKLKDLAEAYIEYRNQRPLDWLDRVGYQILLVTILFIMLLGCSKKEVTISYEKIPSENNTPKVILYWTPPSEYTDGSPLSINDIGGYKIYIGKIVTDLNIQLNIPDNYITTYTFPETQEYPIYVTVTCYMINGAESTYSNIIEIK